jgi:hypothetical protein
MGMNRFAKYGPHLKAIVSALVSGAIAFLSSLLTALQGEHTGFETITDGQWVTAALAFLIGLGINGHVTHRVRNRPARPLSANSPNSATTRAVGA